MRRVDFWYDFASTYSYPAAMRAEALAATRGVSLRWRPFLLGPLFSEIGWRDSPFNIYPAKGRYMWRDLERRCAALGLPFVRPDPFPQNSLLAARVALALPEHVRGAFTRAVFTAEFGRGASIAERKTLESALFTVGEAADFVLPRAETEANKLKLRRAVDQARTQGLFGAPTFVTQGNEVFWGEDRMEAAFDWAARENS